MLNFAHGCIVLTARNHEVVQGQILEVCSCAVSLHGLMLPGVCAVAGRMCTGVCALWAMMQRVQTVRVRVV